MMLVKILNAKERPDVFNLSLAETCIRMVLGNQRNDKSHRANKLRKVLEAIDEVDATYQGYLDDDHIELIEQVLDKIQECTDVLNGRPEAVLADGIVDTSTEGGEEA